MVNFESTGLKEGSRTGETNVKFSLYIPITAPYVSRSLNLRQSAYGCGEVVSARHHSPFPPGNISGTHVWPGLCQSEGLIAADRFM